MMTSSPFFQLVSVATLWFAVSWIESITQNLVKIAPRRHRVGDDEFDFLIGPDDVDITNRKIVCGGSAEATVVSAGSMS
jgi:hypothetical protein